MKRTIKMYYPGKQLVLILMWVLLSVPVFSDEVVDRIIAVVNDEIVTLVELEIAIQPFLKKIESQNLPEEKAVKIIYQLKQDMLSRLIDRKLLDQEATRYNIKVSDQEVDSGIERFKQAQSMTQEDLEAALGKDGMSFSEYRETVKKELLRPKLINHAVKSKIIIMDEEIKAYYEEHINEFQGVQKYHLRNIIHDNEALMQEVKIKLGYNENFAALAQKYSKGKNAPQGGDLGEFKLESLSDIIKESLKDLSVGDYTDVVSTDQGFQLFYIENITTEDGKTLEEASPLIMEILYNQKADEKFNSWLESLREKAHIKTML